VGALFTFEVPAAHITPSGQGKLSSLIYPVALLSQYDPA
jgi:hypothetical protein